MRGGDRISLDHGLLSDWSGATCSRPAESGFWTMPGAGPLHFPWDVTSWGTPRWQGVDRACWKRWVNDRPYRSTAEPGSQGTKLRLGCSNAPRTVPELAAGGFSRPRKIRCRDVAHSVSIVKSREVNAKSVAGLAELLRLLRYSWHAQPGFQGSWRS